MVQRNGGHRSGVPQTTTSQRRILGTRKLNFNARSFRLVIPREGIVDDPLFEAGKDVAVYKEGDGRIVMETVDRPADSARP